MICKFEWKEDGNDWIELGKMGQLTIDDDDYPKGKENEKVFNKLFNLQNILCVCVEPRRIIMGSIDQKTKE